MKKLLLFFVIVLFAAPTVSFAEEPSGIPTTPPPPHGNPQFMMKKGDDSNTIQEKRDEMHTNIQQFHTLQTNLQPTIEAERIAMKQKFQARRDEFNQKISTLKDQKKKSTAELVNTKLSTINQRRTDQMSQNIKKLEEILTKIKTKSDAAGAAGKDVSSVTTAITGAQSAIATAKTAIAAQAAKDYTPQVTDTTALRQAMEASTKQLEADLLTTHKTVVDAKSAVLAAANALIKVTGGTMLPTAAPSQTVQSTSTPMPTNLPTQAPVSPVPSQ